LPASCCCLGGGEEEDDEEAVALLLLMWKGDAHDEEELEENDEEDADAEEHECKLDNDVLTDKGMCKQLVACEVRKSVCVRTDNMSGKK
jgi:hypothetical protein